MFLVLSYHTELKRWKYVLLHWKLKSKGIFTNVIEFLDLFACQHIFSLLLFLLTIEIYLCSLSILMLSALSTTWFVWSCGPKHQVRVSPFLSKIQKDFTHLTTQNNFTHLTTQNNMFQIHGLWYSRSSICWHDRWPHFCCTKSWFIVVDPLVG